MNTQELINKAHSLETKLKAFKEQLDEQLKTEMKYEFTSCNDCINKVDDKFTETCFNCKRYYGCYFERKENE